jgi:hypothetical protein
VHVLLYLSLSAQNIENNSASNHGNKFEQLGTILPTPNEYRTASGAPGLNTGSSAVTMTSNATLMNEPESLQVVKQVTYYNNSPIY